jgi:hypothetical protein
VYAFLVMNRSYSMTARKFRSIELRKRRSTIRYLGRCGCRKGRREGVHGISEGVHRNREGGVW